MVGGIIHEKFAKKMCEAYGKPVKYANWGRAPDYGYWFSDKWNLLMHRFTLHGFKNVSKAIKLLKDKPYFDYDKKHRTVIKTAVVSHTFLDLFNFWVTPSYPKSKDFQGIKEQRLYYLKAGYAHFFEDRFGRRQDAPTREEWGEVFDEIFEDFNSVEDVGRQMVKEFRGLPEKGFMIDKILSLYDRF